MTFIKIQTPGEFALLLQLTTGRTQLNRSYLLPPDFFEHWSTAVWNFELLCDQEVHEVEWGFGGIGRHYMRGHILCISWTQVYKSAQAGVSSNPRGTQALSIRASVIFQKVNSWSVTKESKHVCLHGSPHLWESVCCIPFGKNSRKDIIDPLTSPAYQLPVSVINWQDL